MIKTEKDSNKTIDGEREKVESGCGDAFMLLIECMLSFDIHLSLSVCASVCVFVQYEEIVEP